MVSREKHFEPDVCARVGYPKSSEYINFTKWMKERILWDISLIPVASDMSNAGEHSPNFRHFEAIGCITISSIEAMQGQDIRKRSDLIIVDGSDFSWIDALSKVIDDRGDSRSIISRSALMNYENKISHTLLEILFNS